MAEFDKQEPIAIIGAACRLPGEVSSLGNLWDMINAASLASLRPLIETNLGRYAWDPAFTGFLNSPSWAVIGTEDRVIPPAKLRSMAERAGATITEVPGSHVSMVSNPKATIEAILAAAETIGV